MSADRESLLARPSATPQLRALQDEGLFQVIGSDQVEALQAVETVDGRREDQER